MTLSRGLLALAGTAVIAAASYGQLSRFSNTWSPSGVSGDGSTMVGQTSGGWFYWTQGTGFVNVGGVTTGYAKVSDDGMKIGASVTGPANQWATTGWTEMGIYDRATSSWQAYGNLTYHSGTTASTGWGISGDGNTVLGQAYFNTTAPGSTAARVNPTISSIPGGPPVNLDPNTVNNGRVQASNFDGTVVGGYDRGTNPGTIWVNGVLQSMTGLYNGVLTNFAVVQDISTDGRWVIGNGSAGTQGKAYLYDRLNNTYAFSPNPYLANSEIATVASVSDNGRYVFGRYLRSGFNPFIDAHMFVWDTQLDTVTLLNDIATGQGINLNGFNMTLPGGMSSDGLTFTGMGIATGAPATESFYLHLNSVPEPASMFALAAGVGGLLARRRRKA